MLQSKISDSVRQGFQANLTAQEGQGGVHTELRDSQMRQIDLGLAKTTAILPWSGTASTRWAQR